MRRLSFARSGSLPYAWPLTLQGRPIADDVFHGESLVLGMHFADVALQSSVALRRSTSANFFGGPSLSTSVSADLKKEWALYDGFKNT